MDELLLAEQLFLLLHDNVSGRTRAATVVDAGYAGALLLDLRAAGLISLAGKDVRPTGQPAHQPLLDAAVRTIACDKERTPRRWVAALPRRLRPFGNRIGQSLVDRGVVDEQHAKVLGLFPSTRWPERDPAPERALRERLRAVLVVGLSPDPKTAALLALLDGLDAVRQVVDRHDRRVALRRARDIVKLAVGQDELLAQVHKGVRDAAAGQAAGAAVVVVT